MNDIARLFDVIAKAKIPIIGEIVINPSAKNAYFVPVRLTRRADGRRSPSGLALESIRSKLFRNGYSVDFILIDEKSQNIEESLRASLMSSFPEDVRNSFFSYNNERPQAWIEFKGPLESDIKRRLEEHLRKFSELFFLPNLSMVPIGEANTPTNMEILSVVRQLAPVGIPTLTKELVMLGKAVPSDDWANRRLDGLRKSNLVLRRRDGTYVLTTECLARLGTRKNRSSPDVRRILALARRGS